jgi:hypothetical protein
MTDKPVPKTRVSLALPGDLGEYVRNYYGVPAYIGGKFIGNGRPGVIVGFAGQYVVGQMMDEAHESLWHPTWEMVYE